jgi:hypothetical protein
MKPRLKNAGEQGGDKEVAEEDEEAEDDVEVGLGEHCHAQGRTYHLGHAHHLKRQ